MFSIVLLGSCSKTRLVSFEFYSPQFSFSSNAGYYCVPIQVTAESISFANSGDVGDASADEMHLSAAYCTNYWSTAEYNMKKGESVRIEIVGDGNGFLGETVVDCDNCHPSQIDVVVTIDGVADTVFKGGEWSGSDNWTVP